MRPGDGIAQRWVRHALSVIIALILIGLTIVWLQRFEELPALKILAPRGLEYTLPVYAQFNMGQTFTLPAPVQVVRFVLPVQLPAQSAGAVDIEILHEGHRLNDWTYEWTTIENAEGEYREIPLALSEPHVLAGNFELIVRSPAFDHEHQALAPRVFVEPDDAAYAAGNYRVAENPKKGDISLHVVARFSEAELWGHRWQDTPGRELGGFLVVLAAALWLIWLPQAVLRPEEAPADTQ